jgi:AcrR family transcriptional regulator
MESAPVVPADAPRRRRGRPPQEGLAEQRREQIVEAAYAVFAEQGYEEASISAVAKRAGIGQGTVYRYFDSKRELLDHVVDFGFERLLERTGFDAGQDLPETAEEFAEQLRALAERLFAIVEEEPALFQLVLVEATAIDEELKNRLLGLMDMLSGMTAGLLEHGKRAGWIRADLDASVVAHGMLMLVVPGFLLVLRGEATPEQRTRYVNALAGFLLRGIGAR